MSVQAQISGDIKIRDLEGGLYAEGGIVTSKPFGEANGFATLGGDGKVPSSQLPSYVDDVVEVANYAALPIPGETGKIYITLDTNYVYRWAGSTYVQIIDTSAVWGAITGTLSNQTDLQSALDAKVPYTGATGNVDLGTYGIKGDYSQFNLTPSSVPTAVGTLSWDSFYRTLQLVDGDGDTTLQIGQELRTLVHNNTGSTLTDGQVVYVTGSTGELPSVALASNTSETTSSVTFGVVTESIANGADGFITTSGIVHGLNTLAFNEGDAIWLGSTAGTFTNVKPTAPANLVLIGYVIKKAGGNGSIFVKIQNGYELEELHDVSITSVANNQGIFWDSATSLWKNKSIPTALGYTPADDSLVVHKAGVETITGLKTFANDIIIDSGVSGNTLSFKQYSSGVTGGAGYTSLYAQGSDTLGINFGNIKEILLSNSLLTTIRQYQFPDLSGTFALLEGTQTFSGQKTFSTNPIITSLASANIEINSATGSTSSVGFKVNNSLVGFVSVNSSQFLFRNYVSNEFRFVDGLMTNGGILAMPSSSLQTYTFPAASGTIALTSNLSSYVPYTGATGSVNIGNNHYYGGTILLKQDVASASATGYFSISGSTGTGTAGLVLGLGSGTTSSMAYPTSGNYSYVFPAISGTLALLEGSQTFTGSKTFDGYGIFNLSQLLKFNPTFPTTTAAGYLGVRAEQSGVINSLNLWDGTTYNTAKLSFNNTSSYTYTFPASSGTIALTSNIPTVSGASGQVTYFNGTSSVTGSNNFFWDATNNRLGIGLTNPQRALEVYSATADSHLRLSGSAPSVSLGEAITGSIYQAKFGLATANGQYASGAVAGDFVILSQTGATIFMTNATEKMRVNTSGRLLLGTTTDNGSLLQVAGSATFTSSVTAGSGTSSGYATLNLIDSGTGSARYASIRKNYDSPFDLRIRASNSESAAPIVFDLSNTTEAMRITSSGNVGIGTSSPFSQGSGATTMELAGNTYGQFFVSANSASIRGVVMARASTLNDVYIASITNSPLLFGTNDTERMRITPGGNVGIGTSSPVWKLDVRGEGMFNGDLQVDIGELNTPKSLLFNANSTTGGSYGTIKWRNVQWDGYTRGEIVVEGDGALSNGRMIFKTGASGGNATERMRITSSGIFMVGTTTVLGGGGSEATNGLNIGPSGVLVNNSTGDFNAYFAKRSGYSFGGLIGFYVAGSQVGSITTNGSTTSYVTSSDYRLKEDLKEINGLEKVSAIKVYDYKWKNSEYRMDGVLAHELAEILPYAVTGEKDGEQMQGVDYSKIVPVLVKAIQEQQQMIEELKQLINNK